MYVTHMYSMASRLLRTDVISFSNSGKVEMYGNSRAVLSYILLSSNYLMARAFVFATLVVFWAWTHKTTILTNYHNYNNKL